MTSPVAALDYRQYLRLDTMPHILCPGCGHGIVLKAILRAVHRLDLPRNQVAFVSGIGCSSRIVGYVDFCTLHTTHGRPLTFATGLKLARPELHVIVVTGDGDGLAIGGNHLIHAARRNVDLTCLLLNNAIYGMTGGQGAPTTPEGARSSISPGGAVEPAFDACRLAQGAGATFVARGATAAPLALDDLIARAIRHRGFSLVEIQSDCPEYFGRYNDLGRGPEMLQAQRSHVEWVGALLRDKASVPGLAGDPPGPAAHAFGPTGVLHEEARPEFGEVLARQRAALAGASAAAPRRPAPAVPAVPAAAGPAGEPASGPAATNGHAPPAGATARVRIAGAGGQGIVLAGLLLAEAAIRSGRNATHAQAYGPESRGGASRADVIVADGEIEFPCAERVDVLVALTDEARRRYAGDVEPGGLLLVDAAHAGAEAPPGVRCHTLPLTATAVARTGSPVGANLVALGALAALAGVVPAAALERAVTARPPGGDAGRALAALQAGLALAAGP